MIGIHNAWLLLVVHLSTKVTFVTSGPVHEVFILPSNNLTPLSKVRTCQTDHKGNKPYRVSSVTISHHSYLVRAMHTLFIKLDLPTFGNPHTSRVLVLGSIDGSLATCCRTTNISEKSYGKIHL